MGFVITHYCRECPDKFTIFALTIMLLLDAVLVLFLSIWGIVTNSMAIEKAKLCGACCMETQTQNPIVVYMPADQMPAAINQTYALPISSALPNVYAVPAPKQAYTKAADVDVTDWRTDGQTNRQT